ncbi:succinate dehydrogenase assembly factor 2 [Rhizobium sp. L1K21]|uniref:FAD assembly factor SdhE n=1 Tax=Rhizobium sp. L1K21 TaxID=2954933 RepID=UPI002092FFF6|nr:succinate dehydrogenase assembly factor 2 [Rhizobium sp. L1K21]MCO6186048.1 succinate dehydrogenase assembly factor 2 [Rhizobium sp. L1K21]
MTGLNRTSADLSPRRKRMLYRAWHRGIREMDLILGQYAEAEIGTLSEAELDHLEDIMSEEDGDLIKWINGEKPVPERFRTPMFEKIASYRPDFSPVKDEHSGKPE